MKSRRRKYTREILESAVAKCASVSGVLRELGLSTNAGGNHTHMSKRIREYCIDTSHFTGQAHRKGISFVGRPVPLSSIMVEDSTYSRYHLKQRLLKKKLIENKCLVCGQAGEWFGKPLTMILDHINGVNNDHRRENLRMLCPNCNSQQDTFSGRANKGIKRSISLCSVCGKEVSRGSSTCLEHRPQNMSPKRKVDIRPSKDVLHAHISDIGYEATGRLYGVSGNCIRKWIK